MTRVKLCCGEGGVGKTTVAAALAVAHALAGLRVVVLTIDPAQRLADALGGPALDHTPRAVPLGDAPGTLHAMMLDREECWDALIRRHASSDSHAEALLENRYYQAAARRLGGSQEFMAIETLHELMHDPRWDLVVVDTPPSRHVIDFLDSPRRVARLFEPKWVGALSGNSAGLAQRTMQASLRLIERLAGERVMADIRNFFGLMAELGPGFRTRSEEVSRTLRSSECLTYLVMRSDRTETGSAHAFLQSLQHAEMTLGGVILNRARPSLPSSEMVEQLPIALEPWVDILRHSLGQERQLASLEKETVERILSWVPRTQLWTVPEQARPPVSTEDLALLAPYLLR